MGEHEAKIGTFGHITTRTGPWQRTSSSFIDGDPPHARPDQGLKPVSTIWADARHQIPLAFTDDDGCVAVILGELDAAWQEAEAALPKGWAILQLHHTAMMDQRWQAEAQCRIGPVVAWNRVRTVIAEGSTPAAALRALAAKLREVGR